MTEDSLTFYEEITDEKASFRAENATVLWPMILVMCLSWGVLLGVSAGVRCMNVFKEEGPLCIISSEATQWGSVICAGGIMSVVSVGLYYKNYEMYKTQLALSFVCYFVALIDVLALRDFAKEVLGVPTTAAILIWMVTASYNVRMAIFSRPLTRGKRWKMPLALILCSILFGLNFIALCVLRFRFKGQTSAEVGVSIVGISLLSIYVVLSTIHIKKVKFIIFNAAK